MPTPVMTSAVLHVVTDYDPGDNSEGKSIFAAICLNDLRLYDEDEEVHGGVEDDDFADFEYYSSGAIETAYTKFKLGPRVGETLGWITNQPYGKADYKIPLVPYPPEAKFGVLGPFVYIPGDGPDGIMPSEAATHRTLAYDNSSFSQLMHTLVVVFNVYTGAQVFPDTTDGLATATMKVYDVYVDVAFNNGTPKRYWPTNATICPKNAWLATRADPPLVGHGPGDPTEVLNKDNVLDHDNTTFSTIQATNAIDPHWGRLWNPKKLLVDWRGADIPPVITVSQGWIVREQEN